MKKEYWLNVYSDYSMDCWYTEYNAKIIGKSIPHLISHSREAKMICYVCYIYSPDFKSGPLAVFWYEKDAKVWQKQNDYGHYKKMEIK